MNVPPSVMRLILQLNSLDGIEVETTFSSESRTSIRFKAPHGEVLAKLVHISVAINYPIQLSIGKCGELYEHSDPDCLRYTWVIEGNAWTCKRTVGVNLVRDLVEEIVASGLFSKPETIPPASASPQICNKSRDLSDE